ncbi:LPD29 domain-containing protein [Citricoccus zhacaiensis]
MSTATQTQTLTRIEAKDVAKKVRKVLAMEFPKDKFSVRTPRNGKHLLVEWQGGSTRDSVMDALAYFKGIQSVEEHGADFGAEVKVDNGFGAYFDIKFITCRRWNN